MPTLPTSLARAFHATVAGQPDALVWSNLWRAIPDDGIALRDLAPAARISKRAATAWVKAAPHVQVDGKTVRLDDAGRAVAAEAAEAAARPSEHDGLRPVLEQLVSQVELELPHYPMPYGSADPSAVGGRPHGADWVPVPREGPADGLPLHALLSQALMAFTVDYEVGAGRFVLHMAGLLAGAMGHGEPVPLAGLPPLLGVTGQGKSLLERHAFVEVKGTGKARLASLLPRGTWVCANHDGAVAQTEQSWRERYGSDAIDALLRASDRPGPDYVVVRHQPSRGFVDASSEL